MPEIDGNGRRLLVAKAFRGFGSGLNAVELGLYLAALDLSPAIIGLILSAALVGTMALTMVVALWGDRIGRRRLLLIGSGLMVLTVLIPFAGGDPFLLVVIGLTGMVSVNNNESIGIQTIDQAVLPQTVPDRQRTAAFAVYNLVASASGAVGALAVGPLGALGTSIGLDGAARYAPAFAVYGLCGLASAVSMLGLDGRAEVGVRIERRFALHRSRGTVARLSGLFALDSVATGFIVHSYLAFWFASRFGISDATLGLLFAIGNLLAAGSFPVAAWLAARIGLIRTMVFTHIPANVCLVGMALAPALPAVVALFFLRSALSSMDVPARQSYLMAVVDPDERTAAAGLTNLARGGAQMLGPGIAGVLLVPLGVGVPLVAGGMLKTLYDVGLFALFNGRAAPEELAPRNRAMTGDEG
ncbi:MAG: MFS transporter [Candidatus Limnocylindria bacterium]